MKYNSGKWKHKLRSGFYNFMSPKLYISIMSAYYRLFSKKRRGCTYKFKVKENERVILYDDKTRFCFMGYRRINRYLYPEGLERKIESMKKKYCISGCDIDPGDTVVDVGANVGEFTIMCSQNTEKVFAFEPDPNCFLCLKENTRAIDNVDIINYCASNVNSNKVFYLLSEDADSSLIEPKTYNDKIEINTVRLDSWMDSKGLPEIDFLKIDAEGAELEVLEGLGDKIGSVKKISVDGGPERYGEPTSGEINKFLQLKGFNTYVFNYHVYAWRNNTVKKVSHD